MTNKDIIIEIDAVAKMIEKEMEKNGEDKETIKAFVAEWTEDMEEKYAV